MYCNYGYLLLPFIALSAYLLVTPITADCENLQDMCPTATSAGSHDPPLFINGYPCKSPGNITASDFKSTKLSVPGDTDYFFRSAVKIVTAADFAGLNTLGLSVARTDIDPDGAVAPHSHPRGSEMLFVYEGLVIAGFIDTDSNLFQKLLREGDTMVFPRGLVHFIYNQGFERATAFSVFNGQNPGLVSLVNIGPIFGVDIAAEAEAEAAQGKLKRQIIKWASSLAESSGLP